MSKLNIDFLLITAFTSERFINNLLNVLDLVNHTRTHAR